MIFIYGTKPVVLDQITPSSISCPFCEDQGKVSITAHSSHTHLYYIPMFPLGIKVNSYCTECTYEMKEKEFPAAYSSHANLVRNNSSTPLWQYAGVAIIVLAIIFGIVRSQIKSDEETSYISSPTKGDVYHYKAGYQQYSTMKVVSVYEDSIFYIHNNMEADRSNMLDELNVEENYDDEVYYMLQKELDSLNEVESIIDVIRK